MGTKVNSNYEDLITFTRASGGHALRPVSYGDELVTNGTLDTDVSGWTTTGAGVSAASVSGELEVTNTSGTSSGVYQTVNVQQNKVYKISFTARQGTSTSGVELRSILGAIGGTTIETTNILSTSQADYNQTIVIASGTSLTVYCRTFAVGTAYFDNISVREVLFDQPDAPLTLFEHPTNIPRVEYDADGNRLGLLVEEARTNLITYSEDFSNAAWAFGSLIETNVSSAAGIAPDANNSASSIIFSGQYKNRKQRVTTSDGVSYTFSVWIKRISGNANLALIHESSATGTSTNITITDEWQRYDVTVLGRVGGGFVFFGIQDRNTSGFGEILIYGAQVEEASFPTSYIKTTGSTATRSADVASIPVADFGYNQSAGTWLIEAAQNAVSGTSAFMATMDDSTDSGSKSIVFFKMNNSADSIQLTSYDEAGVLQVDISGNTPQVVQGQFKKSGFVLKKDDFAQVSDGGTVQTRTSGNMPNPDILKIGESHVGTSQLNGHIKSIKYYPRRLTNAQLQDITS